MANRLADATSPYLQQHKDNPVDWWEWGDDAFAEARRRDVPVLLSVGYAACHWCHVMAHESFEDPAVAELMNERFVNVKVDREERPDVDSVYMEAVQAMTGQGGWPMTVWMDHEGRPFFAGTYFPDRPKHGMASFRQVIEAVSGAWGDRREDVSEQAARLVEAISGELPPGDLPGAQAIEGAYRQIEAAFDPTHGGFGRAPKFPQEPVLDFLLRVRREPWARSADRILAETLEAMASGGIHDQLGGGFARYSVDEAWLVPHFEKMLYDNAQLARAYLWAGLELKREDLVSVARSTIDYLARDLSHTRGGFFSSEDADSDGVEGKFYVWSLDEIEEVLGPEAQAFAAYYDVTHEGNFEGSNILHVVGSPPPESLEQSKTLLMERRNTRVRPGLDDKVIASWNGLAIRALAEAGAALNEPRYTDRARLAADFVLEELVVKGTLMRSWREGRTSVPGFLEDHASLSVGLFTLYAATGDERYYSAAMDMKERLKAFARPEGGFYATSESGENLVKRPLDYTDNPLPSGNAMAAEALFLASLYTGEAADSSSAESALGSVAPIIDRFPSMVGHHLAVAYSAARGRELAIVGPDWEQLASVYWQRYRPNVALAGSTRGSSDVPLLRHREPGGEARAFVCENFVCDLPTASRTDLAAQLA